MGGRPGDTARTGEVHHLPPEAITKKKNEMNIKDLLESGTAVTVAVTPADLQEFALYIMGKAEADKAQQQENKIFLTPGETCDALGVKRTTLWRWERSGYLVPVRLGRFPRYRRTDVENLKESGTTKE